ncbi:UNVERIFIED_CONTAM: hypothetical protein NCL1_17675 [Trichonephila clavipes]
MWRTWNNLSFRNQTPSNSQQSHSGRKTSWMSVQLLRDKEISILHSRTLSAFKVAHESEERNLSELSPFFELECLAPQSSKRIYYQNGMRDSKLSRSWPALKEFDLISISEIDFRALKDPKNFRNQEKGEFMYSINY